MLLDVGFFVSLLCNINEYCVYKFSASFCLLASQEIYYFNVVLLKQFVKARKQNNRFVFAFNHDSQLGRNS